MAIYAIDCGFGETKLWTNRIQAGVESPKNFPSIIAKTQDNKMGQYGQNPLYINDQPWAYGQDAKYLPQAIMPDTHQRLADTQVQAILASALWEMQAEGPITLATGIPLGKFDEEYQTSMDALKDQTWHLRKGKLERIVTIDKLYLYPQGLAALIASAPAAHKVGRWPTFGLASLVDIGYRTMDIVILDVETQQALPGLSKSFEVGIGDLVTRITTAIEQEYKELIAPPAALEALRTNKISLYGNMHDVTELVALHQREWGEKLANELVHWWRDQLKDIRLLVTIGGGSEIFNKALSSTFNGCWSPSVPLFANVRGYFTLTVAEQKKESREWSPV